MRADCVRFASAASRLAAQACANFDSGVPCGAGCYQGRHLNPTIRNPRFQGVEASAGSASGDHLHCRPPPRLLIRGFLVSPSESHSESPGSTTQAGCNCNLPHLIFQHDPTQRASLFIYLPIPPPTVYRSLPFYLYCLMYFFSPRSRSLASSSTSSVLHTANRI